METIKEINARIDELNAHKILLPKWYYKQRLMFLTIKYKLKTIKGFK